MNPPAPTAQIIPAAPGWVARYLWLDEGTDTVDVEHCPVVGWAVGGEDFGDSGPVVWDSAENELGTVDAVFGRMTNAIVDAVYFNANHVFDVPEIDEARLRKHVAEEAAQRAKQREQAVSG